LDFENALKSIRLQLKIYNTETLGGSMLYFLKSLVNMKYVDTNHTSGEGGYGKVYKCKILGVNKIPKREIFACKIFMKTTTMSNMQNCGIEAMACRICHLGIILNYLHFMQQ
jgi:hypothetical protein